MKRLILLVAGVAVAVIVPKLLIENVWGLDLAPVAERWLAQAGTGSAIAVIALLSADLFLPIPSSIIMVLSGAAFGVAWGSALSFIGSVGGEWLGFELVRRYGRPAAALVADDEDLASLEHLVAQHGVAAVLVTRALPVVMETMSVVAGLSRMSRARFLMASTVGTLPIVVVYAYAGAVSRQFESAVPAGIMIVAVAGCAWIWLRVREPRGVRNRRRDARTTRTSSG